MCRIPTNFQINCLRAEYPAGCRIELIRMEDPWTCIKKGSRGTVVGIDDLGQILMQWDSGSTISLVPGEDEFRRVD